MTLPMNCDLFTDRLMDYLEQEIDDVTRLAMERHAVSCAECGPVLADLRKLRIDAANLPVLKPSRDLWSGIAARIETPVVAIGGGVAARSGSTTRRRWLRAGLMVASLAGAAALGNLYGARRVQQVALLPVSPDTQLVPVTPANDPLSRSPEATAFESAPRAGSAPNPARPAATPAALPGAVSPRPEVQLAVAALTADYDREIARLRALMDSRRAQLDPVTLAIIERNLAVIDTAIAESKAAIVRDPASRFLIESLNQSLQTKVELMRTAAVLPSRT
jgi:hypothetical protein